MAVHGPRLGDDGTAPGGLPMEPINALAESEDIEGLLFCGTDGGVYASIDGGFAWFLAHPDLPRTPVHDLAIQERENALVIGTHGRSIWILDLNPFIEGLSEAGNSTPEMLPLAMSSPEALTWREYWGERGYGWGDPRIPETDLPVFLPEDGDYVLEISDSTDAVVAQTPLDGKRRGWQTLKFTPETAQEGEFLSLGNYTLSLMKAGDNKDGVSVDWAIVEEED